MDANPELYLYVYNIYIYIFPVLKLMMDTCSIYPYSQQYTLILQRGRSQQMSPRKVQSYTEFCCPRIENRPLKPLHIYEFLGRGIQILGNAGSGGHGMERGPFGLNTGKKVDDTHTNEQ